jgi:hypothetical protein
MCNPARESPGRTERPRRGSTSVEDVTLQALFEEVPICLR